jgi:glycosyltransferase involved in cell wall biosynthesis
VITPSTWARGHLLDRYPLVPARVHVAPPGTDPTPAGTPSADGRRLLCVGTLAPHKGQDLLMEALARMAGLSWSCTLIGRLDSDLPFVASLQSRAAAARISDRLRVLAPRTGRALQAEFRGADVLVVPSRAETFGMVVTEALAAGLPVIATTAGGLPEALGTTVCGLPGLLVPSNDHQALAAALTRWLTDERLRSSLRQAASCRRRTLPDWRTTRDRVAAVLAAVRDEPDQPSCRGEL